jgi:hypothetical protein
VGVPLSFSSASSTGTFVRLPPLGRDLTSLPAVLPLQKRPVTYIDTNALSDISRLRDDAALIPGI